MISKAYNYMNSVVYTAGVNKRAVLTLIIVILITLAGSETSDETSTLITLETFDMLMVISCMAVVFMSRIKNGDPALRDVLPVTRRRRVVYDFIIPLAAAAAIMVMFVFFMLLLSLAISLFVWLFSGENPFVYDGSGIAQPFLWTGFLATFFRFVLVYSFCQIIAHADKYWWIVLIAAGAVGFVWTMVPVWIVSDESVTYSFYMAFSVLSHGWLYVLISGIVSAAALVFSVIFASHTYKPKDF